MKFAYSRLNKQLFCILLTFVCSITAGNWQENGSRNFAVITSRVVDLFIKLPLQENPPLSAVGKAATCKRAHQGLYNEVVQCVEYTEGFVRVVFDNVIYGIGENNEPLNSFWISEKHLVALTELEEKNIPLTIIPAPLNKTSDNSTLVLTFPWNGYSIGTRFTRAPQYDDSNNYAICRYNPQEKVAEYLLIPANCSRTENKQSPDEARATFVSLINTILDRVNALPNKQVISYAWGGSSATKWYTDEEKTATEDGRWIRPTANNDPYSGYDCSELVLRMAQTSGIKYPFKTTLMLAQHGETIKPNESLKAGDLLWIPGHVCIISDLQKNEIIEARGFDSGFGKVHRVPLNTLFHGMNTYADLQEAYHAQKPLIALKKDGSPGQTIVDYKLIKLPIQ